MAKSDSMPGSMTGTFDFIKNMWGRVNMPSVIMPTLSVEEINKQITDLKAVESWLALNMNMLQGTIQALQVQSATIATLQSMSETMRAAVASPPARNTKENSDPDTAAAAPPDEEKPSASTGNAKDAPNMGLPLGNPAMWWNMLQQQFQQAVKTATAAAASEPPPADPPAAAQATPVKSKRKPAAPKS